MDLKEYDSLRPYKGIDIIYEENNNISNIDTINDFDIFLQCSKEYFDQYVNSDVVYTEDMLDIKPTFDGKISEIKSYKELLEHLPEPEYIISIHFEIDKDNNDFMCVKVKK